MKREVEDNGGVYVNGDINEKAEVREIMHGREEEVKLIIVGDVKIRILYK